jgi:ABC-type sugar transport system permease subunit
MSEFFIKILTSTVTWIVTGVVGPIIVAAIPRLRHWLLDPSHPVRIAFFAGVFTSIVASSLLWSVIRQDLDNISRTNTQIEELRVQLASYPDGPPTVGNVSGGGDAKPPTECPTGYYATGINWWGSPGSTRYCIGCLSGIQVICRKIRTE